MSFGLKKIPTFLFSNVSIKSMTYHMMELLGWFGFEKANMDFE